MLAPDIDVMGIYIPMPAFAIAIVLIALPAFYWLLDRMDERWYPGLKVARIGFIQVCVFLAFLGAVLRALGGPASVSWTAWLDDFLSQMNSWLR
jgi:hypothetical protein